MKKRIIISFAIVCTFSLGAFGFIHWDNQSIPQEEQCNETFRMGENPLEMFKLTSPEGFIYDVNPRFMATITKEKILNAQTISDLVPDKATDGMSEFSEVKIGVLTDKKDLIELGTSDMLNPAQRELLHAIGYSNNFYVTARCKYDNQRTGQQEDYDFVYYVSVIPEKQAEYKYGLDGLEYALQENSKHIIPSIDFSKLQPGKLRFTITREGKMTGFELESSSGSKDIDKVMLDALKAIPQEWEPATNHRGEKVDQELVFSYGMMGC